MKRWLLPILIAMLVLVGVLLVNAWRAAAPPFAVEPDQRALDADAIAARLGAAIAIPTVSATADAPSLAAFHALHALLETQFPRLHAALEREVINEASLLYRWPGRERCAPVLLAAHQDVVPVEPGTEGEWQHPPFSGRIADGAIWGRGAIDDKGSLLAILEAVEQLLADGFAPRCDVLLAFGHDEEVGGADGAAAIAGRLAARGLRPSVVLDEGGAVTVGSIAGLTRPLATIGVAEKGYASVRLLARGAGGHSSMPPRRTAIGRLARAVARLEADRPAAEFGPVQRELLARIAPHSGFGKRLVLANLWLTAPLVEHLLAAAPASDATLRTTTAPTLFTAGVKENVLPQQAAAVVNFRIRPGDSIDGVLAHVRETIDDDGIELQLDRAFASEPTAPASWQDPAFVAIEHALRRVARDPALIVAPYVTSGATDARHYAALTPRLFRFLPLTLTPDLLASFHGTDERVPIDDYLRMVRFYLLLVPALDALPAGSDD